LRTGNPLSSALSGRSVGVCGVHRRIRPAHATVLVRQYVQNGVRQIASQRPSRVLKNRAYLNLCHVAGRISRDIRTSAEKPREIPFTESDLSVENVEAQDQHAPVGWHRLVKTMDQTLDAPTRPRNELRWNRLIMNPPMGRETHHRLVPKQPTRTRCAVDNVRISICPLARVSVSPANVIVSEIGLHVLFRHRGNRKILPLPPAHLDRHLGQGYQRSDRGRSFQSLGPRAIANPSSNQKDHSENPRHPDRCTPASHITASESLRPVASGIRSIGVHLCVYPKSGIAYSSAGRSSTERTKEPHQTGPLNTSSRSPEPRQLEHIILCQISVRRQAGSSQNARNEMNSRRRADHRSQADTPRWAGPKKRRDDSSIRLTIAPIPYRTSPKPYSGRRYRSPSSWANQRGGAHVRVQKAVCSPDSFFVRFKRRQNRVHVGTCAMWVCTHTTSPQNQRGYLCVIVGKFVIAGKFHSVAGMG